MKHGFLEKWRAFSDGLRAFYVGPYYRMFARHARDENDLFMLIIFAESLGIANPLAFYTLELQPIFLEQFHDWHQRMGMERSPLDDGFGCC